MRHPAAAAAILATATILSGCGRPAPNADPFQPADEGLTVSRATPENPPMVSGSQVMMRAKLAHAQAVLEGIALSDFDQIHQNARNLTLISQETDWHVHRTIQYNVFSSEFRQVTGDLANHAAAKNIHAATLDYMQMIMVCVKCHSHMRNEGLAQIDNATPLALGTVPAAQAIWSKAQKESLPPNARGVWPVAGQ